MANISTKPNGLPNHWPRPTDQDLKDRPVRHVKINADQAYHFHCNMVKTSKYEWYNFLPKFLLEEFNPKTKIANCYFLIISALQCIPAISNTQGYPTTMVPLTAVVSVNAVLQLLEDLSRHRADKEANASTTLRLNRSTAQFEIVKWSDIVIGDCLKIVSREQIPADLLILGVSEKSPASPQGLCYVETKSLDGETNLKIRLAMPNTYDKVTSGDSYLQLSGYIDMEHPNKLIDSFSGVLDLGLTGSGDSISRESIGAKNVLLRGCSLRNTDWAIGVVINTGPDTKIMMSSTETKPKSSQLDTKSSEQITVIIGLLCLVCVAAATGQLIWNYDYDIKGIWYLHTDENPGVAWVIKFFYSFLLHASCIPVSLYVSMSVARFYQSVFMNQDLEMYYEVTDSPAQVRTMTLNEELGQISHIFSDKTGTLTCNVMDFRKMSINGVSYGLGITEIGKAAWKLMGKDVPDEVVEAENLAHKLSVPHVSFYDPKFTADVSAKGIQQKCIAEFFRVLSICHDVIPERINGKIKLSASNPDDEALVCASSYFGYQFADRRGGLVVLKKSAIENTTGMLFNDDSATEETVEVLDTIPFTSKRKRMSVIIREKNGTVKLLMKGADTAMFSRMKGYVQSNSTDLTKQGTLTSSLDMALESIEGGSDFSRLPTTSSAQKASDAEEKVWNTEQQMITFAHEGLRCLVVGSVEIPVDDYLRWSQKYRVAMSDFTQIEAKKIGESNDIEKLEDEIEQNLDLLGATAIEDRLQDGVPECISALAAAGIKLWVLTGDKEETAINIAVACNLVLPGEYMRQVIVNRNTTSNELGIKQLLNAEMKLIESEKKSNPEGKLLPRALIIDGPSLIEVMKDNSKNGLKQCLLEFSQHCQAVVGCRVSPDQKREMVRLVKNGVPGVRTLSVGDGANDVAMIQEAHVGVGIKGEEGLQAVNSSDFAIGQFQFLSKLILKHGRYNYIRMSNLVCYIFYKNILFSFCHFWYNFLCAFSGQKYFTEGGIQMFNVLFTSIPIMMYAIYDKDMSEIYPTKIYPQLFQKCIKNQYFNSQVFWSWIATATYESVLLTIVPLYFLDNSSWDNTATSHWAAGSLCLTAIVIICNIKIFLVQSQWMWVHYVVLIVSVLSWVMVAYFISSFIILDFEYYHVWYRLMRNINFWLGLVFLVVAVTAKDAGIAAVTREMWYSSDQIVQELSVFHSTEVDKRKVSDTNNNNNRNSRGVSPGIIALENNSNNRNSPSNRIGSSHNSMPADNSPHDYAPIAQAANDEVISRSRSPDEDHVPANVTLRVKSAPRVRPMNASADEVREFSEASPGCFVDANAASLDVATTPSGKHTTSTTPLGSAVRIDAKGFRNGNSHDEEKRLASPSPNQSPSQSTALSPHGHL